MMINSRAGAARVVAGLRALSQCALVVALVAGCAAGDEESLPTLPGSMERPTCEGAPCDGGGGLSQPRYASLRLAPDLVTLTALEGAPQSQSFTLLGVRADGTEETLRDATFRVEHDTLGAIDATGLFTTRGTAAGVTHVFGYSGSQTATATVTVRVERTIVPEGLDPAQIARFTSPIADETATMDILYPLENAVMPRNVAAPEVHWSPIGIAGDVFRLRVATANATLTTYVAHSGEGFRSALRPDRDSWSLLANSDDSGSITIRVDRLDAVTGRTLSARRPLTFRVARGSIYGQVYYWNLSRGETHRIDPVEATSTIVVPAPPPQEDGVRCVACHTVSRDGRYLWGRRSDGAGQMFDLTADLRADPAPTRYPLEFSFATATFDPTGRYLLGTTGWAGNLGVLDAATGTSVGVPGMPTLASFPEWAPVGDRVAYMGDIVLDEVSHPVDADLFTMPMTSMDPLTFGAPTLLHDGATLAAAAEGGTTDSHPTWSPDGKLVAFQHGPRCFTNFDPVPPGALYVTSDDGTNVHRLDALNGGSGGISSYWPTFSPYTTQEREDKRYFWVAFFSRRDYGNAIAGTQGSARRQIWVAAIDTNPGPGDPSFVPYWLPGQDSTVQNIAAYWAPDACRATGEACSTGGDCCSEVCEPDSAIGGSACAPPPAADCRGDGETCGGDSDCCEGFMCTGNRCYAPLL